ncbi:hypothetical protein IV203_013279 [Nitzschia inconspicua]|uniref:Uncharacterized protein n=1 Tax=Nitzschia inconspicua TaxID=303405 RepID=A0A9K3M5F3_9STRA|nr:hypothetical protein IV203_013279 [Nitzschia inconspicua]
MSKTSTPLEAVAVAVENSSSVKHILHIPPGQADLGIEFAESPPKIVRVDPSCIFEGKAEVGLYVHVLRLPELEIVNLRDSQHLVNLLQANVSLPRELWLSENPSYVDTSLGSTHTGALYKHVLPATENLGVLLVAFPPIINVVREESPMKGRLIPGQTVEALLIPGRPRMDLAAGAFTDAKVTQALQETSHIEGRMLVVKDAPHAPREKGTSAACVCEDCVIS